MNKLSIITIVKKDTVGLNKTIDSVLASKIVCEHLIIDGSESKLYINKAPEYLKHFWGSDQGISDAFNRGIFLSSGQYLLFLNAGDELLPNASQLISEACQNDSIDCAWFPVFRMLEDGRAIIFKPRLKYLRYAMSAPHQGLIMQRKVFTELGGFPMQKYAMDHYLVLKMISASPGYLIKCFNSPIATYPSGGHSTRGGNLPFIYNIWNVIRISPKDFPVAILANLFLIAKSKFIKRKIND